jgi:hypothetical protein
LFKKTDFQEKSKQKNAETGKFFAAGSIVPVNNTKAGSGSATWGAKGEGV